MNLEKAQARISRLEVTNKFLNTRLHEIDRHIEDIQKDYEEQKKIIIRDTHREKNINLLLVISTYIIIIFQLIAIIKMFSRV